MTRFALFALLLAGCTTEEEQASYVPNEGQLERRIACGGIAGYQCPTGMTCEDDPSDSCDPNNGGADCIGVCKNEPGGNGGNGGNGGRCKDTADFDYIGCGDECAVIRFACAEGTEYFSDDKGCGCQVVESCGSNSCYSGEYCCNASCGICVPEGGFCTQQACTEI